MSTDRRRRRGTVGAALASSVPLTFSPALPGPAGAEGTSDGTTATAEPS